MAISLRPYRPGGPDCISSPGYSCNETRSACRYALSSGSAPLLGFESRGVDDSFGPLLSGKDSMESEVSLEKTFYTSSSIKVTNTRFIVNQKTYAMASVSSVKVGSADKTPSKSNAVIVFFVGLALFFIGIGNLKSHWLMATIGVGLLVLGIKMYRAIKPVYEYKLILTTSSGETTALSSNEESDIRAVESALNDAIVFRG